MLNVLVNIIIQFQEKTSYPEFFSLFLQGELLKCKDIHAAAEESKTRLEQMRKDCLAKIDRSNRDLTYKHEQEVGLYFFKLKTSF